MSSILVFGATGALGSQVTAQFAQSQDVRAVTRDAERARVPTGVEAVCRHLRSRLRPISDST